MEKEQIIFYGEDAKEWLEEGNLLFYDEASGYYVESL